MDTFEQAVLNVQAQRQAPLNEAKKMLAPARAATLEGIKNHEKMCVRVRPVIDKAMAQFNKAVSVGITEPNLRDHLYRVCGGPNGEPGLMAGGLAAWQGLLQQIDGLTERDVAQDLPRYLMNRPTMVRANTGALWEMAQTIEKYDLPALEEYVRRVRQERPGPATPVVITAPREPDTPPVETKFNL